VVALLTLVSYLLTPAVLVGFHWLAFRWLRQPPPLFFRRLPRSIRQTVVMGSVGAVIAYLVPVTFFIISQTTEGVAEGLVLDPVPGRPAEGAGLKRGDRAVAADGETLHSFSDLVDAVKTGEAESVELLIERDERPTTIVIPKDEHGIGARQVPQKLGFADAASRALPLPTALMARWVRDLFALLGGEPVKISSAFGAFRVTGPTHHWRTLATRLSVHLVQAFFYYTLVLVLDTRSRLTYQRRDATR
jgi:membrane-associated protease RseP (regulator of RpoE activity)